jgi:hypothetical protein
MTRFSAEIAAAIAMGLVGASSPAFGQQPALVNVDIKNVADNIARNIKADVSQIPLSIQVPVDVAATVCGVAAQVLGPQAASGSAQCAATSTSAALDRLVQDKVKSNTGEK